MSFKSGFHSFTHNNSGYLPLADSTKDKAKSEKKALFDMVPTFATSAKKQAIKAFATKILTHSPFSGISLESKQALLQNFIERLNEGKKKIKAHFVKEELGTSKSDYARFKEDFYISFGKEAKELGQKGQSGSVVTLESCLKTALNTAMAFREWAFDKGYDHSDMGSMLYYAKQAGEKLNILFTFDNISHLCNKANLIEKFQKECDRYARLREPESHRLDGTVSERAAYIQETRNVLLVLTHKEEFKDIKTAIKGLAGNIKETDTMISDLTKKLKARGIPCSRGEIQELVYAELSRSGDTREAARAAVLEKHFNIQEEVFDSPHAKYRLACLVHRDKAGIVDALSHVSQHARIGYGMPGNKNYYIALRNAGVAKDMYKIQKHLGEEVASPIMEKLLLAEHRLVVADMEWARESKREATVEETEARNKKYEDSKQLYYAALRDAQTYLNNAIDGNTAKLKANKHLFKHMTSLKEQLSLDLRYAPQPQPARPPRPNGVAPKPPVDQFSDRTEPQRPTILDHAKSLTQFDSIQERVHAYISIAPQQRRELDRTPAYYEISRCILNYESAVTAFSVNPKVSVAISNVGSRENEILSELCTQRNVQHQYNPSRQTFVIKRH